MKRRIEAARLAVIHEHRVVLEEGEHSLDRLRLVLTHRAHEDLIGQNKQRTSHPDNYCRHYYTNK